MAKLASLFTQWTILVSFSSVLIAFSFAAVVGVIFSLYTAREAAKLNPIEALRHE